MRFFQQIAALSRKNARIRARQWRVNLLQLVQAAVFMFVIWLIVKALSYSNEFSESFKTDRQPKPLPIKSIPLCEDNLYLSKDRPCYTIAYSPRNNTDVLAIIRGVMAGNDPPIPESSVLGLDSMQDVDDYLVRNPQTVLAAAHFFPGGGQTRQSMGFILQTNSTGQFFKGKFQHPNREVQIPLQVAIEREATRLFVSKAATAGTAGSGSGAQQQTQLPPAGLSTGGGASTVRVPSTAAGPITAPSDVPPTGIAPGPESSAAAQDWLANANRGGSVNGTTFSNVTGGSSGSPNPFAGLDVQSMMASMPETTTVNSPDGSVLQVIPTGTSRGGRRLQQAQDPMQAALNLLPKSWKVAIQIFAHPATVLDSFVGRIAPTFIFASSMFNFVLVLYSVVQEKELGLRQAMEQMGLTRTVHWTVWALWEFFNATLASLVIQALGYAFQFDLWRKNDFWLTFLLVLENNLVLTAMALACSTALKTAANTIVFGFVFFFVAWIMMLVVGFGFPFAPNFSELYRIIFSLFPWPLLAVGFTDLGNASVGAAGEGLRWKDRDRYCFKDDPNPSQLQEGLRYYKADCTTSIQDCLVIMAIQIPAYLALTWYWDTVMPDAVGNERSPLFFLEPSYWGFRARSWSMARIKKALPTEAEEDEVKPEDALIDPDVLEERRRVARMARDFLATGEVPTLVPSDRARVNAALQLERKRSALQGPKSNTAVTAAERVDIDNLAPYSAFEIDPVTDSTSSDSSDSTQQEKTTKPGVALFGLSRKFTSYKFFPFGRKDFQAVHPTFLSLNHGECLCLLGSNGAGKTTTIRMLTGILGSSGGDALQWGESVVQPEGMKRVRSIMGVCPQFDVLYNDLTALEHLELYAAVKGLPGGRKAWREEAMTLLREVRLDDVANKRAGQFSGGMRRRLSCAVALLGDPYVLFLDEPTTGMDPLSKRHVWSLIDRVSKDRVVVLTTHSMQEADVLGDRIAIMARGKLRSLGTSIQLKERHGSGYRLTILLKEGAIQSKPLPAPLVNQMSTITEDEEHHDPAPHTPSVLVAAGNGNGSSVLPSSRTYTPTEVVAAFIRCQVPGLEPMTANDQSTGSAVSSNDALSTDKVAASASASSSSMMYAVPRDVEDKVGDLLESLESNREALGIRDVYLTMSPLEEVFLNVVRTAELEFARQSEAKVKLYLEENDGAQVELEVAVGEAEVTTPGGVRYRVLWQQDEEGKLHAQRTERL